MAQAVHSSFQFFDEHETATLDWLAVSKFLVIVSVPDEAALLELDLMALGRAVPKSLWREPDRDNEATALALAPGPAAARLCARFPLALREPVPI